MRRRELLLGLSLIASALTVLGCSEASEDFDAAHPERGPGELVGNGEALNALEALMGGMDAAPAARDVEPPADGLPPTCGADCQAYCADLGLKNPVNRGICTSLWGVGLEARPVVVHEACRRLFADMIGRFPTRREVAAVCEGRPWDAVVAELIETEAFIRVQQQRWADAFLYNNQAVSVERIYDMDALVRKLYQGRVAYDAFAAVASAHPVVTRRYDTAGDRTEAVFRMFMGRPPLGNERSDLARLYTQWANGYYDHPQLGMRLPDATIAYRCVNDEGQVEPGACTSILYGYNELVLTPDLRASADGQMWSGLLTAEEWAALQMPGRLLSRDPTFWEHAVDQVLEQYLDYDLGTLAPDVRRELVRHLLAHDGDLRAVHMAVATSLVYLQSASGATPRAFRWTYGPLKQANAETWIDTLVALTDREMGRCDHRISRPEDLVDNGSVGALALLENSAWQLSEDGEVRSGYRSLARGLGGCPANEVNGRFKTVSILTTASQLSFVADLCNPALDPEVDGVDVRLLLPEGVGPDRAVDAELAEQILRFQLERFYSRDPLPVELDEARSAGETCQAARCRAEEFARPACFALLSSAEMLFY